MAFWTAYAYGASLFLALESLHTRAEGSRVLFQVAAAVWLVLGLTDVMR